MGRPVVGQHTPRGNAMFADLVEAVFELESILCPDRPASRMVAINRRASFLPHKDSGTEALYILMNHFIWLYLLLVDYYRGRVWAVY